MRHISLRTLAIAAVAAAALTFSGAAWAQQKGSTASGAAKPSESSSEKASPAPNCVHGKSGDCITLKSGSSLDIKSAPTKAK